MFLECCSSATSSSSSPSFSSLPPPTPSPLSHSLGPGPGDMSQPRHPSFFFFPPLLVVLLLLLVLLVLRPLAADAGHDDEQRAIGMTLPPAGVRVAAFHANVIRPAPRADLNVVRRVRRSRLAESFGWVGSRLMNVPSSIQYSGVRLLPPTCPGRGPETFRRPLGAFFARLLSSS